MIRLRLVFARVWDRLFPRSCWAETYCWSIKDGALRTAQHCDVPSEPGVDSCWCGKKSSERRWLK